MHWIQGGNDRDDRLSQGSREGHVSRRDFLKAAGAAGATIGLTGGLGGLLAACGTEAVTTTTGPGATTTQAPTAASTQAADTTTMTAAADAGERYASASSSRLPARWPPSAYLRATAKNAGPSSWGMGWCSATARSIR